MNPVMAPELSSKLDWVNSDPQLLSGHQRSDSVVAVLEHVFILLPQCP